MIKNNKRSNPAILREGMSIGSGNAESDDEFLFPCFVDYPAVEQATRIGSPGLIVSGRTGAGKTAILRHVQRNNDYVSDIDPAQMSMNYVSNSDALRFLQAIGADLDLLFQVLWKHVLCIELIRLRFKVDNEDRSRSAFARLTQKFVRDDRKQKSIKYLSAWENRFWITMDQNVKEITEKTETALRADMGAEIEKFKAGGQYDKRLSTEKKSELVARARTIINSDQLVELHGIIDLLSDDTAAENQHRLYILIDRLDENWVDESIRFKLIRALMVSLKSFKKIQNLKVLVALRADILERVVQETQDITFQREKFEDSFIKLRWSRADLRSLVDKRIAELLRRQYSGEQLDFDDVFASRVGQQDTFDYLLDRTLMRPRDIIAFVNECLGASDGQYEVTSTQIRKAEIVYARKRRDALEQEWKSAFPAMRKLLDFVAAKKAPSVELRQLLDEESLEELSLVISSDESLSRDPLFTQLSDYFEGRIRNPLHIAAGIACTLYRTGAVGIKVDTGEKFMYSHIDDPLISPNLLSPQSRVRIHPMLHAAYRLQEKVE